MSQLDDSPGRAAVWIPKDVQQMIAAEWMYHPYHFEMYQS